MPKLGCGLDGLDWKTVHLLIKLAFLDTDIKVVIYENLDKFSNVAVITGEPTDLPFWDRKSIRKKQNSDPFCQTIKEQIAGNG